MTVPINRLKARASVKCLLSMTPDSNGPSDARTNVPLTLSNEKEINTSKQSLLKIGSSNDVKATIRSSNMAPPCLTWPTSTFAGIEKTRN